MGYAGAAGPSTAHWLLVCVHMPPCSSPGWPGFPSAPRRGFGELQLAGIPAVPPRQGWCYVHRPRNSHCPHQRTRTPVSMPGVVLLADCTTNVKTLELHPFNMTHRRGYYNLVVSGDPAISHKFSKRFSKYMHLNSSTKPTLGL